MHVWSWLVSGLVAAALAHVALRGRRSGWLGDLTLGMLGAVAAGAICRWLGLTPPHAHAAHLWIAAGGAAAGVAGGQAVLRAAERAAIRVERAREAQALEGRIGEVERRIVERFLRRRPVSRDPATAERPGFGDRVSDRIATFGGSWSFIGLFALTVAVWMIFNEETARPFDPFPFILLNLVLSCLAAVQAPVILMSQNRQAEKDRRRAQLDYEVNLKAELEVLALHEKIDGLREKAWGELVEQQKRQLELLDRILARVAPLP